MLKDSRPEAIELIACPECGRTNAFTDLKVDGRHWTQGVVCEGKPIKTMYVREDVFEGDET